MPPHAGTYSTYGSKFTIKVRAQTISCRPAFKFRAADRHAERYLHYL